MMKVSNQRNNPPNFWFVFFFLITMFVSAAVFMVESFQAEAANDEPAGATYAHGVLYVSIPYEAAHAGSGRLTMEVLDPEDKVLGRVERRADVADGTGRWQEQINLENPLALDDLVSHPVRYHFDYINPNNTTLNAL